MSRLVSLSLLLLLPSWVGAQTPPPDNGARIYIGAHASGVDDPGALAGSLGRTASGGTMYAARVGDALPLPHNGDGTCMTDAAIEIFLPDELTQGMKSSRAEVSTLVDNDTCVVHVIKNKERHSGPTVEP